MPDFKDLTGHRFNKLVVQSFSHENCRKNSHWLCQCDCGNMTTVPEENLINGSVRSCGCLKSGRRTIDLTNQRFGRLVAKSMSNLKKTKYTSYLWNCLCDCGNTTVVPVGALRSGHTTSCGCLAKEIAGTLGKHTIHEATKKDNVNDTRKSNFCMKLKSNSATGVRGVSFDKNGTYRARINFRKKSYALGTYTSLEKATQARRQAESVLWGNFALSIKEENPKLAEKIEKILAGNT